MGEAQGNLFEPDFIRAAKVQSTDQRLTSNAGVILLPEAEHRLGLVDSPSTLVTPDTFASASTNLIRKRVFAMALGYSAQDDLDRLAHDPVFPAAAWNRSGDQVVAERLASQPTQSRLIDTLTRNTANIEVLRYGLAHGVERDVLACGGRRVRYATVDIDSVPIEVQSQQHGAKYNGY